MTRNPAAGAALFLSLLLAACPRGGAPDGNGSGDGAAPEGIVTGPDSRTPPEPTSGEPAPASALAEGSGAADEVPRPPTLPSLMRRIGFLDASPADLDAFVHLPPGAEGQAGTFGRDTQTVRVALIGYPNERYVRPHVTDVNERIRLLPQPREAIIANGRWVVHVSAADLASAQAVAEELRGVLGW